MDAWQIALLVLAGYVAVTALVRLMRARRDALVEQFRGEYAAMRKKKRRAEESEEPPAADKAA